MTTNNIILTDKDKTRAYKPYANQIFYDRKNNEHVIIKEGSARSETNKEAVVYLPLVKQIPVVIMLVNFNAVLDDNYLRFIRITDTFSLPRAESNYEKALELLKEASEELSGEDQLLQSRINKFLQSL